MAQGIEEDEVYVCDRDELLSAHTALRSDSLTGLELFAEDDNPHHSLKESINVMPYS